MDDGGIQVACLAETWRVKANGVTTEEISGGYLIIHNCYRTKTCARERSGVAIVLSSKPRAALGLGGSRQSHGGDGRALTTEILLVGGQTWAVGAGYAPCSGRSSAEQ